MAPVEFKNKNDYTVIAFYKTRSPIKLEFVHNLYAVSLYFKKKGDFYYMNVYARRSGRFLKRYQAFEFVPPKFI